MEKSNTNDQYIKSLKNNFMTPFLAEFLGTSIMMMIGNGVVANVVLPKTKGNNGGLISIVLGWTIAVFVGVYISNSASGAHLNPAVTIAFASAGKFSWSLVPSYLLAQLLGSMLGAFVVWMDGPVEKQAN